jgi:uncharacterized protein with PIN domain
MTEHRAEFRFYEELNDFLPPSQFKVTIEYPFDGHPGIKDPIEALGVPHSEVDLIVVNGCSVGFDYQLQDGDRVAVYPCFEALDIKPIVRLRDAPLRKTAFVLDVHLGKLARPLRLLGFDALYRNDYDDRAIIDIALSEHRIILTRDRRMLFHRAVTHAYLLKSTDPMQQAREVVSRFDLAGSIKPFHRCLVCNGVVSPVSKEAILDRLQPLTRARHDSFTQCGDCGRVFWKGSHYERLVRRIKEVTQTPVPEPGTTPIR